MEIKKIIFFFPSHDIGGGQLLFIRYAEAMAKNYPDKDVFFVDFVDGFAHKQLKSVSNIQYIDFIDGKKTEIPANSVVIFTLNHLWHFREGILFDMKSTLFIFWTIAYNDIFIPRYVISKHTRKILGKELIWLTEKGIIRYLGPLAHEAIAKQYDVNSVAIESIPHIIPTSKYASDHKVEHVLGDVVRFCWLGRLDKDKFNDILTYLNELEQLNKTQKVTLSLVGRGDIESELELLSKEFSYPISFVGEKRDDALDLFIRNNVDIGLASGTSSLEFALRKVPVIHGVKLSRVYSEGECALFNYIEESPNNNTRNFQTIYSGIVSEYQKKCNDCFNYAISKSPEAGAKKMYDAILQLETIDITEAYTHIFQMSDLLSKGIKRNKRLNYLRKILNYIRKR